ncbi:MAG TPA: class I SAM-dependent methyltransferase [Acidobacteriota bacterium]|nr:class I SAM-dependent methyltransferase [Acidobacteriota bacterium]
MSPKFVAALHYTWLDKFYDPFISLLMPEMQLKRGLIDAAEISLPTRVLDIGCGTGTFCLMLKQAYPDLDVSGIDPDQEILKLAKKKASKKSLKVTFVRSVSVNLPFPDGYFSTRFFDSCISSS